MKKVVAVRPLAGYRIWLRYADGTEGEVDLSDIAGQGVFEAWNDSRFFESVHVDESGAVAWPDGVDLCPDALYLQLTEKSFEEVFQSAKSASVDA